MKNEYKKLIENFNKTFEKIERARKAFKIMPFLTPVLSIIIFFILFFKKNFSEDKLLIIALLSFGIAMIFLGITFIIYSMYGKVNIENLRKQHNNIIKLFENGELKKDEKNEVKEFLDNLEEIGLKMREKMKI